MTRIQHGLSEGGGCFRPVRSTSITARGVERAVARALATGVPRNIDAVLASYSNAKTEVRNRTGELVVTLPPFAGHPTFTGS